MYLLFMVFLTFPQTDDCLPLMFKCSGPYLRTTVFILYFPVSPF